MHRAWRPWPRLSTVEPRTANGFRRRADGKLVVTVPASPRAALIERMTDDDASARNVRRARAVAEGDGQEVIAPDLVVAGVDDALVGVVAPDRARSVHPAPIRRLVVSGENESVSFVSTAMKARSPVSRS